MNALNTIQKTCKVFHVLAKIVMSFSFVWAALNILGVVCCLIWHFSGGIPGGIIEEFVFEKNGGAIKTIGILLGDFVFGLTDGILFFYVSQYLKQELADGTPFTIDGANKVKSLGVKTIVMPLVAICIYSVIYTCFQLSQYEKFSNGSSIILGIALLLVSVILRHGAELREEKNENK